MSLNCGFIVRRGPAPSPAALAFMDIARTIERGVARDGPSRAPDGAPRSAQPKGGEGLAVGAAVEMETAVMGIVAAILKVRNFQDLRISKSLIHGWDAAFALPSVRVEVRMRDFS